MTGGARRVGRATSLELARRGCDLALTYRESEEEARSLAREAAALGAKVRVDRLDLADTEAVENYGAMLAADAGGDGEGGGVDILVHNASIYRATPLETITPEDALEMYRVNALSPLLLTAAAWRRRWGARR